MEDKIKQLMHEVVVGQSPGRLAEINTELSAWYSKFADELENILVFKADKWMELREKTNSDKSTDRTWDSLEEGKKEIRLRSQLKYIEKVVSSIKLQLRIKTQEAYNNF